MLLRIWKIVFFAARSNGCRILAAESISPSLQFIPERVRNANEDEEARAVRHEIDKRSKIIEKRVDGLVQWCSVLISHGGTTNDTEADDERTNDVDDIQNVETAKELKVFLRHRSDLLSLRARDGADTADVLEAQNG